jgi:hypothetical protein
MRSVIGEYESLAAAQRAVLALEAQVSVQSVVVRDQSAHRWRRRDQRRDRSLDSPHSADFIVSMSGDRETIERARKLLHPEQLAVQ